MFRLMLTAGAALLSVYFFWRFWAAWRKLGWKHVVVAGLLVALLTGRWWSVALRWIGVGEGPRSWQVVLVTGMVLLFWFLCFGCALQLWSMLARVAGGRWPRARRAALSPRAQFIAACSLVVVAAVWGWFEARNIRVRHVVIETPRLPAGSRPIRIAQITDLHVGAPQSGQRVDRAVELLGQIKADIIVSTGDIVDGDLRETDHLAEKLASVEAPLGKFAVLGNHEFYAGVRGSMSFLSRAGFTVLRQQTASPAPGLLIAGVDYQMPAHRGGAGLDDPSAILSVERPDEVIVLLKHAPTVDSGAVGRFDLQLSGHTHDGQVFPFGLAVGLLHQVWPGVTELGHGSKLYLSRGTGTWGTPLRLLAPPEITVIELRPVAGEERP